MVSGEVDAGAGVGDQLQTASYDVYGNLTQLITGGGTQAAPASATTNRLTLAGTLYDGAGNLTQFQQSGETYQYTYDGVNMMKYLVSKTDQARIFVYTADDERLVTLDCVGPGGSTCAGSPARETWTLRDLGGNVLRVVDHPWGQPWSWRHDYLYRDGGGDPRQPQSWNRYAYVLGNPINNIDPLGLIPRASFNDSICVSASGAPCGFISTSDALLQSAFNFGALGLRSNAVSSAPAARSVVQLARSLPIEDFGYGVIDACIGPDGSVSRLWSRRRPRMNAIRFETTVDEAVAGAMPSLRPMLGRRVEVIALEAESASAQRITLDEFLAHRLKRPADVEPVTLEDMDSAIGRGALGGDA